MRVVANMTEKGSNPSGTSTVTTPCPCPDASEVAEREGLEPRPYKALLFAVSLQGTYGGDDARTKAKAAQSFLAEEDGGETFELALAVLVEGSSHMGKGLRRLKRELAWAQITRLVLCCKKKLVGGKHHRRDARPEEKLS
jgi:hypothetical protein